MYTLVWIEVCQHASTGEGFLDLSKCLFGCICPHEWRPLSGLLVLALSGPFYAGCLENHTLAFRLFYGWASAVGPFYLPGSLWRYLPSWLVLPIPILLSLTARLEQFGKWAGDVRISLDEPPVEVDEAQEDLDIVNALWLGPLGYRFYCKGV